MKKFSKRLISLGVSAMLVAAMAVAVSANVFAFANDSAAGDAAAGVEFMKERCIMCHSVPDPGTIRPYDVDGAYGFLSMHMVEYCGQEDADIENMLAYFFHL